MTMMPAKNNLSWRLSSNLRISETITMVVVRLSRMALRKNVTRPTSHISLVILAVLMRAVMTSNPLCASTTSTIVIAAIRKNTIPAMPRSDSPSCSRTRWRHPWDSA